MMLGMVVMWLLAGLLVGLLAGFLMKSSGYGLRWDVLLGLVGSLVGSGIDAGMVSVLTVALVGAAILIVAQRKVWPIIV